MNSANAQKGDLVSTQLTIGKRFVKGIFAKVIFGANQKTKGLVIYSNNKPFRILK